MAAGPKKRPWLLLVVVLVAVLLAWWQQGSGALTGDQPRPAATPSTASAPSTATDPDSGLPRIAEADLPPEARATLRLIEDGGPYPYEQDDSVFSNREGILPDRPEGHYREYTVETPGAEGRGARRIVAGSDGELYWTDDHYRSFSRIEG